MNILTSTHTAGDFAVGQKNIIESLHQSNIYPRFDVLRTETPDRTLLNEWDQGKQREIDAYYRSLSQHAHRIGSQLVSHVVSPGEATLEKIAKINDDPDAHGLMLFSPLFGMNESEQATAYNTVAAQKDVDGLSNKSRLRENGFFPATAAAVAALIKANGIAIRGEDESSTNTKPLVVRFGNGLTVGRPLGEIFSQAGAEEVIIAQNTPEKDKWDAVREADVIIAAAGAPGIITAQMLNPHKTQNIIGVGRKDIAPNVYEAGLRGKLPHTNATLLNGVGKLTVAFTHDNTLRTAQNLPPQGFADILDRVAFGCERPVPIQEVLQNRALTHA